MLEPSYIQHTRAALALTAVIGVIQKFSPPPELKGLIAAIHSSINGCAKVTRKKRLSQGARRDLAAACDLLAPWLEDYKDLHPDVCFFRFATVCYCALTLVEDVCNICPAICAGPNGASWQALRNNLADLCAGLLEMEQGIDISGSDLYECAVDALTDNADAVPLNNMKQAFTCQKAA